MMTMEQQETYSPKELARIVGRPERTIVHLCRTGVIPHDQPGPRCNITITREDAERCFPRAFSR